MLARNFHKSTVAAKLPRLRRCGSIELCSIIRPHNHVAAVATCKRVGINLGCWRNISLTGVSHFSVLALIVATNANVAAASCAICVYKRVAKQTHAVAEQINGSALTSAARSIKCSIYCNNAAVAATGFNALANNCS